MPHPVREGGTTQPTGAFLLMRTEEAAEMPTFDSMSFLAAGGEGNMINSYRPNETIFKQGDDANTIYFLQNGRAKESVVLTGGRNAVVSVIENGRFFGINGLFYDRRRTSTVQAVTRCTALAIRRDAMTQALLDQPDFAQFFMAMLVEQIGRADAEKIDLMLSSSERRVAHKLLALAECGDGRNIGPEINQELLASIIGTTRPRINYFLNDFRRRGLIRYNDTGITILPGLLSL